MKKLLVVSSEFPPMPGGIGNHAYHLSKGLTKQGFSVTVLTEVRSPDTQSWQKFVDTNGDIEIIGIPRAQLSAVTYAKRLLRYWSLLLGSSWHAVIFSGKFSVFLAGLFAPTRSVVIIHGTEIKQRGASRRLFWRGISRASQLICVSNYTLRQLLNEYPSVEPSKVAVINNGIRDDWDRAALEPPRHPSAGLKLVTVGGIHRRKGQINVVRAVPEIAKIYPKVEYHIAGLPTEKDKLCDEIERLGLQGRVFFHHDLSDIEVRDLLQGKHIFAMLSEHLPNGDFEGFGIAVVEAMAMGLPAIGSRNSGIEDAIADGHSGRLVDPKDAKEIAAAVEDITRNYFSYSRGAIECAARARWGRRIEEYRTAIENQ